MGIGCEGLMNSAVLLSILAMGLLWDGQNREKWAVEDKRGTIEVYAEFDPDVGVMWQHLNDVQNELNQLLDIRGSGETTQIILFSSRARYLQYVAPQIPVARSRKAIFYKNGDVYQIYAFRSQGLMTDLRHEFTHAILHQHLPFLPLWLDEGLAEYLEEPASQRNQSARLAGTKWKSRLGWNPSLRQLEAIPSAASMTEDDYRDSWAWVTFLLTDSETTRQLLKQYTASIARGEAPAPFSTQLNRTGPSAGNRINSYFRKFRFPLSWSKD